MNGRSRTNHHEERPAPLASFAYSYILLLISGLPSSPIVDVPSRMHARNDKQTQTVSDSVINELRTYEESYGPPPQL